MTKLNLYDQTFEDIVALIADMGEKKFRAKQIWEWLYQQFVSDIDEMTNLSKGFRVKLKERAEVKILPIAIEQFSNDGQTDKVLFRLDDGQLIETVLMRYEKRRTLCISTQAGCAMGCVFCATGQQGFERNLTSGEIVSQVIHYSRKLAETEERVTNIVMMGMGEPLHNYDQTLTAVDTLIDARGLDLGARKITISTVGLVPAILRYADEQRQTPLAVSLHAATDEARNKLIPVNNRWNIAELMDACNYYILKTGRQLTIEWALIANETDTIEQGALLGELLRGMLVHVNLIPLNPTADYGGVPSERRQVTKFQETLEAYGVTSTVRVRRGIDIQAGCGQLRDRALLEPQLIQIQE